MKENIDALIADFKKLKVLVVGDAILDTYTVGTTDSISREAPVLVLNVQERQHRCGGAANTAINVAALGAEAYFLTVLGRDAPAREIGTILRRNHVHTEYLLTDKTRTTVAKQRIVASSNILLRTDEGSLCDITETYQENLLERFAASYQEVDAVILSDYGYGILTQPVIEGMKTIMQACAKPLVVDAKDLTKYKTLHPTAVKPNFNETLTLLQVKNILPGNRVEQLLTQGNRILLLTGARHAVVTLDADGVLVFEKGKQPHHIPCTPRDNTKTIGAGDTFTSALTLALALKAGAPTAAEIASAAAAVVVQKNGTAVCSNSELSSCFTSATKFTTLKYLVDLVKELKKEHKKIVFTNGCFDLLHKGHIALLDRAREAGDVLIVGVNSDSSIRALKGPGRPINSLDDRITVLAGLQSVNYLVSFDEESSDGLIQALRPDIFVKGGNYTPGNIREMPLLKKLGCDIKIIPYVEDHSTRYIIDKIKQVDRLTS